MTAERSRIIRRTPEAPLSEENSLMGKTAIVTGGSRDVGAAIVRALSAAGVRVAFSFKDKQKRAEGVMAEVAEAGGFATGIQADMSEPEGRESFFNDALEALGSHVDFLILSGSGRTDELNRILSNHALDRVLLHMSDGGVAVRMDSVPGRYADQLEGSFSIPQYNDVARRKNQDIVSLFQRIPEMSERGVKFIEVCPSVVPDTSMVKLLNHAVAKETGGVSTAEGMHDIVSDRLGLPRSVSTVGVAEKIVDLLKDSENIKSGHTEFFNGTVDVLTLLKTKYGTSAVYGNTLKMEADIDGQRHGIVRAIISKEQATRPNEVRRIDESWIDVDKAVSRVRIVSDHARGHFTEESGLPQILPGHEQIRMAVEAIEASEKALGRLDCGVRLAGFTSAEFLSNVESDGSEILDIVPIQKSDGSYDVKIVTSSDNQLTAVIKGVRVRPVSELDSNTLLETQIIAGAIQAEIVVGTDMKVNEMPFLSRIGRTEFVAGGIKGGEGITYDMLTKEDGKGEIDGSVVVSSEGHIIGVVTGIKTILDQV